MSQEVEAAVENAAKVAASEMDELAFALAQDSLTIQSKVEIGRVEDVILSSAAGADAVVVGSHSRTGIAEKVIGTTADRVLRHSATPVVLVPSGG